MTIIVSATAQLHIHYATVIPTKIELPSSLHNTKLRVVSQSIGLLSTETTLSSSRKKTRSRCSDGSDLLPEEVTCKSLFPRAFLTILGHHRHHHLLRHESESIYGGGARSHQYPRNGSDINTHILHPYL